MTYKKDYDGTIAFSRTSTIYQSLNDLNKLNEKKIINEEDYLTLLNNLATLQPEEADKMIENVITVFGMPLDWD